MFALGGRKRFAAFVAAIIFLFFGSAEKKLSASLGDQTHLPIGNFALPVSQQPGPLFSGGQNIVDKGDFQFFSTISYLRGSEKKFSEIAPSILYGITDSVSLLIAAPFAGSFQQEGERSAGVEDLFIELEWAAFDSIGEKKAQQITLFVDLTLPSGSVCKLPPTGLGAPSLFSGFTAAHMTPRWYFFISGGILATMEHRGFKEGTRYLYQAGVGVNISSQTAKYICTAMLEMNGIYAQHSLTCGIKDPNTGASAISLGPSIWFSTQNLIIQLGVSVPVMQHLFGEQPKNSYFFAAGIGWKFNA